jgi:hypothetical protein
MIRAEILAQGKKTLTASLLWSAYWSVRPVCASTRVCPLFLS